MTKHEQTILVALRKDWFIEEIQELIRVEPITVHNVAKRHGLKARHAPRGWMRSKKIALAVQTFGREYAAARFRLDVHSLCHHLAKFPALRHS